jgi:hypothetical protein
MMKLKPFLDATMNHTLHEVQSTIYHICNALKAMESDPLHNCLTINSEISNRGVNHARFRLGS